MKKKFIGFIFSLTALLLLAQSSSLEAREHRRSTRVQVNLGNSCGVSRDAYVVRRYARPAVYAPVQYYSPVYVAPSPAQVYVVPSQPYVEEVYVVPERRPIGFGGLSFSWNFFR